MASEAPALPRDAGADAGTGAGAEVGARATAGTGQKAEAEAISGAEPGAGRGPGVEAGAGTEAGAGPGAGAEPGAGTGAEAGTEPGAGAGSAGAGAGAGAAAVLSRNKQKKLAKQQLRDERREAKRQEQRRHKEAAAEAARKAAEDARGRMTPGELAAAEERVRELQRQRQLAQGERHATWRRVQEGSPRVIIDLGFEDLMGTKELASLQQQVMFAYGLNVRSDKPCRLTLTSCAGKILSNLEHISGFDRWRLERHCAPYEEVFAAAEERASLVYLTSDAPEELKGLDPRESYIVGGIVDHNRHKRLTLTKAQGQGIRTARLPSALFPALTTSKVLTVNQVFEVLLTFWSTSDWSKALQQAIPERKKEAATATGTATGAADGAGNGTIGGAATDAATGPAHRAGTGTTGGAATGAADESADGAKGGAGNGQVCEAEEATEEGASKRQRVESV